MKKPMKIGSALSSAGFGNKLKKLLEQLFTQVTTEFDKNGVDFSGGESQKIAVSHAFLHKRRYSDYG